VIRTLIALHMFAASCHLAAAFWLDYYLNDGKRSAYPAARRSIVDQAEEVARNASEAA